MSLGYVAGDRMRMKTCHTASASAVFHFFFSGTSKIFSILCCPKNNRHYFKRSNTFLCFLPLVIYFFNIFVCLQNPSIISCRILITKGKSPCCTNDRLLAGEADRHTRPKESTKDLTLVFATLTYKGRVV